MNNERSMSVNEIFLYRDIRNESIHFIRCFRPSYGHGDHIHTAIKTSEVGKIIDTFEQLDNNESLLIDSIPKSINLIKSGEDEIELDGAIFSDGWIVRFCSLKLKLETLKIVAKILSEKDEKFFEDRTGPIYIEGSNWFTYDKP